MVKSIVICEKRFSHVVFQYDGNTLLTFLSGGPIEVDCTIVLTNDESDAIVSNHSTALALVHNLIASPILLATRKLVVAVWPDL
jgi:hypothetical protein